MSSKIVGTIGISLNILGIIILYFFVHKEIYADGHQETIEKSREICGWLLIIFGSLIAILSLWI